MWENRGKFNGRDRGLPLRTQEAQVAQPEQLPLPIPVPFFLASGEFGDLIGKVLGGVLGGQQAPTQESAQGGGGLLGNILGNIFKK